MAANRAGYNPFDQREGPKTLEFITRDGRRYRMLHPEELSADQMIALDGLSEQLEAVDQEALPTIDHQKRVTLIRGQDDALNRIWAMIVPDAPADVIADVPMMKKMVMFRAWQEELALPTAGRAGGSAHAPPSPLTSRNSAASTAGTRRRTS